MAEKPIQLETPPGVVMTQSPLTGAGRYVDCSWVRFWRGRPQKIGGYVALVTNNANQIIGIPRGATAWSDSASRQLFSLGTNIKLYMVSNVDYVPVDITPWRVSLVDSANPISTTNGSNVVTVTYAGHGAAVGDYVDISGYAAVGGLDPTGSWVVDTVPDANHVTFLHTGTASSTATGGGVTGTIAFEISPGLSDPGAGYGWGVGTWNSGTWGTPRPYASIGFQPRVWTFGSFGKVLISSPSQGAVYSFDPSVSPLVRAAYISTAPTVNIGVLVTSDLITIAYGSSYDPATGLDGGATKQNPLQWWAAKQGVYTNWNTAAVADAQGAPSVVGTVREGTRFVGGGDLGIHQTLMWTDTALYLFQYTGSQFVFNILLAGKECGLIGPMAFVVVGSEAYWMGPNGFFLYNGGVNRIPNYQDVSEWVLSQIRDYYTVKTVAWYNQEFDEVWFGFVPDGYTEPKFYVAVNRETWAWTKGTFPEEISAATRLSNFDARPIVCGSDGDVYQMDNGVDADGQPLPWSLTWGPIELDSGRINTEVSGVVVDMESQVGTIHIQMTAYDRSPANESSVDSGTGEFGPTDGLVDFRVAGRIITMAWNGGDTLGDTFRLGEPRLLLGSGGSRR